MLKLKLQALLLRDVQNIPKLISVLKSLDSKHTEQTNKFIQMEKHPHIEEKDNFKCCTC